MGLLPKLRAEHHAGDLLQAVKEGRIQDVGRFLDRGADVDQTDEDGASALACAADAGHLDIMDLLLQVGARVYAEDTSLFTACCKSGMQAVRLLYRHISDAHSRNMFLVAAAASGSLDVATFLIAHGAEVSAPDSHGWTPLMMASMEGHQDLTRLLLENGAQVNATDVYGGTALMAACQFGNHEVAALLIDHRANVNARTLASPVLHSKYGVPENWSPPGMTSLTWACRNGHSSIVALLLSHGATVDARDGGGWIPLMWAALGGHADAMLALLSKGADPCARTTAICTSLFAKGSTSLMMAAHRGRTGAVAVLLDNGADIAARDQDGKTALMFAARAGHPDVVRLLLDRGAAVDEKNDEGLSALAYALIERHDSIAEALRATGAREPVLSGEAVSLTESVPIPSAARVRWPAFGATTVMNVTGIALMAIAAFFLTTTDFTRASVLQKEAVGRPLSSFIGFLSWLDSEQGSLFMVLAWVVLVALVTVGFATRLTMWVAESRQWDAWVSPRIGRAVNLGGLTLIGSAVMLLVLCSLRGLSDEAMFKDIQEIGIVYIPAYIVCGGALILAFVHSGRERFPLVRILGVVLLFFFGSLVPLTGNWNQLGSPLSPAAVHVAFAAVVLLYMALMLRVGSNSLLADRSLLTMISRSVLLLPVIAAGVIFLCWGLSPLIDSAGRVLNGLTGN